MNEVEYLMKNYGDRGVVFLLFLLCLTIILPSSSCCSYSWNKWSVHHLSFYNENNSISSPGLLG